jgi:amino acid transporter
MKADKDHFNKDSFETVEMIEGTLPGDRTIRRRRKKRVSLKRTLGIPGIFSIAYGNLGSSIYFALGITAVYALGATPLVFMLAAIFFIFTAMSYAEGTAAIPEAGGSSSFARRGFNETVSFIAAWCLLLMYMAATAITSHIAISYLSTLETFSILKTSVWHNAAIGALLLFLMLLNIIGVRKSSIFNVLCAGIDLTTQAFLVLLGALFFFNPSRLLGQIHWGIAPSWPNLAIALFLVTISFTGIETVANMAEESKTPETTIPKSMWWSAGMIIFIFLGLSSIALNAMPVTYQIEGYIYSSPIISGSGDADYFDISERMIYYRPTTESRAGEPMANALVSAGQIKTFTNNDGYFKINGLGANEYILNVLRSGYNFSPMGFDTRVPEESSISGQWTTELADKWRDMPLLGITEKMPVFGGFLRNWISLLAFIIMVIATNAGILGVSRLVFSMGSYKQLPPSFAKVNARFRTPYIAIIIFTSAAFLLALSGKLEDVAGLFAFGAMISYTIAHVSIIAMRIRHPEMKRPYRIPINIKIGKTEIPVTALIGAITFFALWIIVLVTQEYARLVGIPFILVGLLIYVIYRFSQKLSLSETVNIRKRR